MASDGKSLERRDSARSIRQTAEVCKQHLREKYRDRGAFIVEFEGTGKDSDLTRWSSLTDIRGIEKEMLSRLDAFFETWLNP